MPQFGRELRPRNAQHPDEDARFTQGREWPDRKSRQRAEPSWARPCTGCPMAWPGSVGYGRLMPNTKLLAQGSQADVDPVQSELAQLDVSLYRTIRLSVGNWEGSPGPVIISISHVDQPHTPNANLITGLDSFTLVPGGSVSKAYQVPGEVIVLLANPETPPMSGIQIDFTLYGRTN
jgi:hypothetical protein